MDPVPGSIVAAVADNDAALLSMKVKIPTEVEAEPENAEVAAAADEKAVPKGIADAATVVDNQN